MIFRKDLYELYCINVNNVYLAATYDFGMILTEIGKKHICELGLVNNKYMQAGLLLINSRKIIEDGLDKRFFKLYKKNF